MIGLVLYRSYSTVVIVIDGTNDLDEHLDFFSWGENQAVDGNTHRNVKYVVVIMLFKSRFRLEVSPPN